MQAYFKKRVLHRLYFCTIQLQTT